MYVLTTRELAERIVCLADHLGLVGPNYQFLFFQMNIYDFKDASFIYKSKNYTCSHERMIKALEMNLFMNFRIGPGPFEKDLEYKTVAGITYSEFKEMYEERLEFIYDSISYSYGLLAYGAVWSLALCLNSTVRNVNLAQYGPGQYKSTRLIRDCFNH